MTYIVLDFEWNQPPIGRQPCYVPFPLVSEIMEIGAVKLDENYRPAERYRGYVHQHFYTRVHPYVKRITHIDEATLHDAPEFPDALAQFREFCGQDYAFVTWGPDDLPALCDNLLAHGMDTSFIPDAYNLQHIFNLQKTGEDKQWSLADACEYLGIERELPDHDALSDAYHTALICGALDFARGIEEYPRPTRPERHYSHPERKKRHDYPAPLAEISVGGFADRGKALRDTRISYVPCPVCGQATGYERFFTQTKDKRIALCDCPEHGDYIVKVYFRPGEDGVSATRRVFAASDQMKRGYEQLRRRAKH